MSEKTPDEIIASFNAVYYQSLDQWIPRFIACGNKPPDIALQIAYLIFRRRAGNHNFTEAEIQYLFLAIMSDKTSPLAQLLKGDICFYNIFSEADNSARLKSAKAYYHAALEGNDFVHLALGDMYQEVNQAKAIAHYEAIDEKYSAARYRLGYLHWSENRHALAKDYLVRADQIPHSRSILANIKRKEGDASGALALYQSAATEGAISGLVNLGYQYLGEELVKKDPKIAIKYLTVCQQGGLHAHLYLAKAYIADEAYIEAISHICDAYLVEYKNATLQMLIDTLDKLKIDKNNEPDPRVKCKEALIEAVSACKQTSTVEYIIEIVKAIKDFPHNPNEHLSTVQYRSALIANNHYAFTNGLKQDPLRILTVLQREWSLKKTNKLTAENRFFFEWVDDLVKPLVTGKKKTLDKIPNWVVAWLLIRMATVSLTQKIPETGHWIKGKTYTYLQPKDGAEKDATEDELLITPRVQLAKALEYLNAIPNDPTLKPRYIVLPKQDSDKDATNGSCAQTAKPIRIPKIGTHIGPKQFGAILALYKNAGVTPKGIFSDPHPRVRSTTPHPPIEPPALSEPHPPTELYSSALCPPAELYSPVPHPPPELYPFEPRPLTALYRPAPIIRQASVFSASTVASDEHMKILEGLTVPKGDFSTSDLSASLEGMLVKKRLTS
jgi:hypothetical protein